MPVESDIVRQRLAGLREQKLQQRIDSEELARRIRNAVAEAQQAGVPMTQIAALLGMDRSAVYRTYVEA